MTEWNMNNEWNMAENELHDAKDTTCAYLEDNEVEVLLEKKAEKQIRALCSKYENLEWMAALIGTHDKKENSYTVKGLKILEQEVSGSTVELTPAGNTESAKLKGIVGMIHSHNSMNAYHSAADITNASMYQLSLVVNNDFSFDGRAKLDLPCGKSVLAELKVMLECEEIDDEILKNTDELIIEKKFIPIPVPPYNQTYYPKTEIEYCGVCGQKIGKNHTKHVFCNTCQTYVHERCYNHRFDCCDKCAEDLWEQQDLSY